MFENSTAIPPIFGVPQPVPTLQETLLIVTAVTVAVLNPFANVWTKVGSLTVIELPLVLDHVNWVYVPVKAALNVFQAVSIVVVGAILWVKAWENVVPVVDEGDGVGDIDIEGVIEGVTEGVVLIVVEGVTDGVGVGVLDVLIEGVRLGVLEILILGVTEGVLEIEILGVTEGVLLILIDGVIEGVFDIEILGVIEGVVLGLGKFPTNTNSTLSVGFSLKTTKPLLIGGFGSPGLLEIADCFLVTGVNLAKIYIYI